MERVFGIKKYRIEKNGNTIDIYGGNSLYNNYDAAVEDAFELDADEIVELVFESEYSDIPIDVETVWMNPNRDNVTVEDDEKETEGNKNYTITYYLNTACRERRPTTQEDVENDWKVIKQSFNTDLEAYEYVMKDCLQLDDEDLEDIYSDEDAQNEIEKIEAIQDYFDNQDISDGSIILVSIEGPEQSYDFGFEKPDVYDDLEENLEVNYSENISKESAINRAKSCARRCYQTRNGFDIYFNKMKSDEICNKKLTDEEIKLAWNEYLQSEIDEIEKFKV